MASASKAEERKRSGGSNPSCCVLIIFQISVDKVNLFGYNKRVFKSNIGDWSNGMIGVSKTFGGSSILSSPAIDNQKCCLTMFLIFLSKNSF